MIFELVRIKLNGADVLSVMTIVLHGDLECPVNRADVLALNIVPLSIDQLEERLELDVLIDHLLRLTCFNLKDILVLLCLLWVLALWLRFQTCNFSSQADSLSGILGDQGSGFGRAVPGSTESADLNELARCSIALELIVHGRIHAEDVLVADGKDPDTRLVILVPALVEEE